MISVRTLGPVRLSLDGANAPPELLWRKNFALLLYLARSPDRSRSREHLAGLLWGDKPETTARHSLNEALRVIRRTLGEDSVQSEGHNVVLTADVKLDIEVLEQRLADKEWEEAAELVGGPFLEGFGVPDSSAFEDWVSAERRVWLGHSVQALVGWAELAASRGDLIGAVDTAGRALALDPLSDPAARAGMRAAALTGDRTAALEQFEDFRDRLAGELGVEPQPETIRLADRIRLQRRWRLPEDLVDEEREARRWPLAGRETALQRAMEVWRAVRAGDHAAVLAIEGEPGLGKTRLAEEIISRARLDGGVVARIRAVPADVDAPWSGLAGLCRAGLVEAPGLVAAPPGALAAIAEEVPEWGERFADEVGDAEVLPLTRAMSEALRAVLEEQPTLLFIDDAEWLDEESGQALRALLRDLRDRPLAVGFTTSRLGARGLLDELRSDPDIAELSGTVGLEPLDPDALAALARHACPWYTEEETDRLVRRIEADSAGFPILAVALLDGVRLGLELKEGAPEAWPAPAKTLDQTPPTELPDTVVAAIRISFRRLSDVAQRVLSAASVLGERVDPALLARVVDLDEESVAGALDELEWQRWIEAEPRGYTFVARVVRQVISEDMLTRGQRQRIMAAAEKAAQKAAATAPDSGTREA
jgi:DNA-binding SARP family transcriptional activator